jgi:hypothetical protein
VGSKALAILKTFITSWFVTLETRFEYKLSREIFSKILRGTKKDIGEHAVIAVEELVRILDPKKRYLYHYNFVGKTTLGFKGDSIVEASFSSTKRKRNQISTRKSIDKFAMFIVKDSVQSSNYKHNLMQQQVEREVCWSRATVRNDLTKYALGLFCKNFDKKDNYYSARIGECEWLSIFKEEFQKKDSKMEAPSFKRVRKIVLDKDGFLNCSCGKTGEYLLPCKHICSVVTKDEYFSIDRFHIRWHKQFALLHGQICGKECSPQQTNLMKELLETTRRNHYDSMGKYRGVPMDGSSFLKELETFKGSDGLDQKLKFMLFVEENSVIEPVQSISTCIDDYEKIPLKPNNLGQEDLLGDFSLFSQEEFQETEMCEVRDQGINSHKSNDNRPYHSIVDGLEKVLNLATTKEDVDEINMFFSNFVNKRIAQRNRHTQKVGDVVLYGENLKNGYKIDHRHKFFYETL